MVGPVAGPLNFSLGAIFGPKDDEGGKTMYVKHEDWGDGWYGVKISLNQDEIDRLIQSLQMIKDDPDQHFHISSDYKEAGGVGDIEISVNTDLENDNMVFLGRALSPGDEIPDPT